MRRQKIANALAVARNTSNVYSDVVQLLGDGPRGNFGLQVNITGGTVTGELYCSNDGTTYAKPDGVMPIFSSKAAGNYFFAVSPPACSHFKILFTEANVADATITAILAVS